MLNSDSRKTMREDRGTDTDWKKTSSSTMRNGEWCVIRMPWKRYILWHGDKMLAVVRYAVEKFGIQHFVIDSLMKCGYAEDDYNGQKSFVDNLCSIARDTGVHIHLVHHSRKGKDEYAPPGKHDMKGSGAIIDQVDNLIIVWRNKKKEEMIQAKQSVPAGEPDTLLIVEKQRNGEWEGKIALWFDQNGRGLTDSQ